MDVFVARQPIYDCNLKVFGYELLYRSSRKTNRYIEEEPDVSTISVVINTFLNIGIDSMTNKKLGFINFTANLLVSDLIKVLPQEYLGIEILENVDPTDRILSICQELKSLNYTIVLDDYCYNNSTKKLLKYADIIKMDFLQSSDEQLQDIVSNYKSQGIRFLAEKIETRADFIKAKSFGYDYFQGYYFQKPTMLQYKDLPLLQISALKLLEVLQNEACTINEIASIISSDPGIVYKLFRLVNSVMYGGRKEITDVTSAIMRIGLKDLQTWILYIMLYGTNKEKPDELIKQSMIRALVAEEICIAKKLSGDISSFFLIGLFSLMDVIMDVSFEKILLHINLPNHVTTALTNPGDDMYGAVIRMIRSYDETDLGAAQEAGELINLPLKEYQKIYQYAIKRCDYTYDILLQ